MVASINFFADGQNINNAQGSGLGFYGATFGSPVAVSFWQNTTWITDAAGANQGPQVTNIQYANAQSGYINSNLSGTILTAISNYQATLNVQVLLGSTPYRLTNSYVTAYDRVNVNNIPSGVTCAVAQLIHPDPIQYNNGSGDNQWRFPAGTSVLNMPQSPGISGLSPSGLQTFDTQHDWYFAISASPNSVSSKNWALFTYFEYY